MINEDLINDVDLVYQECLQQNMIDNDINDRENI